MRMPSAKKCFGITVVLVAVIVAFARNFIRKPIERWDIPNLSKRTFLVVGSTSGIGMETMRCLSEWGAGTVVAANRNIRRSMQVAKGYKNVVHKHVDLTSFRSVRNFVNRIKDDVQSGELEQFDVLILNAATTADKVTGDGVDMQYQVNHLSHFLLVNQMLKHKLVKQSGDVRVIFVSSSMHRMGHINKEAYSAESRNVNPTSRVGGVNLYSDTKLMNVMIAVEFNDRYNNIAAFSSLHPGFIQSMLDKSNSGFLIRTFMPYVRGLIARETREGALTQLRVATDAALSNGGTGGRYFSDNCINSLCQGGFGLFDRINDEVMDPELRAWLWETSVEIVGEI